MKKLPNSLIAFALVAVALPAAASANGLVIAQAEAVSDYQAYLGRMMDEDTMRMLDKDEDGTISRDEFMQFHKAVFDNADKNGDGKIMKDEMPAKTSQQG